MEIDNEEQDDRDIFFELEESTQTVDEAQTPVTPVNMHEVMCNKLLNLSSPKVALSRTGIKSMCMEQMLLLGKMDPLRSKELQKRNDFHMHECKNCGMLMNFQWKVRVTYENKPGRGGKRHHAAHADRHMETHCNEADRLSIQQRLIKKVKNELNMNKMV